ncbi:MAG: hypothetical protein OZ948_04145 [Deltaproteobacteria bacterium]|nr:hypothetical protein [Deltaproteobacteria bacterium]
MPWDLLEPGDLVRIHWRAEPYREKWVIGRSGTAEAPIVVRGVPGPNGERPVVSGDGATTPELLDFTGKARAVIKIGTANVPDAYVPEHVVVEGSRSAPATSRTRSMTTTARRRPMRRMPPRSGSRAGAT